MGTIFITKNEDFDVAEVGLLEDLHEFDPGAVQPLHIAAIDHIDQASQEK
jgi:hypothetical protein